MNDHYKFSVFVLHFFSYHVRTGRYTKLVVIHVCMLDFLWLALVDPILHYILDFIF